MQHRKHASAFELYRNMQGMICMWKKYLEGYPEARLFLSVLSPERSHREGVKHFLKVRKAILRSLGPKLMQDVTLTHCTDLITVRRHHRSISYYLHIRNQSIRFQKDPLTIFDAQQKIYTYHQVTNYLP